MVAMIMTRWLQSKEEVDYEGFNIKQELLKNIYQSMFAAFGCWTLVNVMPE